MGEFRTEESKALEELLTGPETSMVSSLVYFVTTCRLIHVGVKKVEKTNIGKRYF